MRQLPLALRDGPDPGFDNFRAGRNELALAGLRAAADALSGAEPSAATSTSEQAPAGLGALVYLWGPTGSGKTHLLHALARQLIDQGQTVGWFDADDRAPWAHDDAWSLVVFDDCDRYDADQQHAAFSAFVSASTRGIGVAAAGRLPPTDLRLRDDLRSRLGWGQVLSLEPLGEDDTRAVLACEVDRRRLPLSSDVIDFLLTRFERDLKHLIALLDRLDDFALAARRTVTVPLLKQMLAEEPA